MNAIPCPIQLSAPLHVVSGAKALGGPAVSSAGPHGAIEPGAGAPESGTVPGALTVPVAGVVTIALVSPRPLRLRVDGVVVVEEELWWRRFERQLRVVVVLPLAAGEHVLSADFGARPECPRGLDHENPSRNRAKVRRGIWEIRPDRFELTATVMAGAAAPPACLRFLPAQCVIDGVTYQHVLARRLDQVADPANAAPGIGCDVTAVMARKALALRSPVAPFFSREASDDADRAAGRQRLLVPVANHAQPLPVARAPGAAETRLEPECAVVGTLSVTIDDALAGLAEEGVSLPPVNAAGAASGAGTQVTLPIFEARGRLAPHREHRGLAWPTVDDVLGRVPKPSFPAGAKHIQAIHDHAWRMLLKLRRGVDPRSGLCNDYIGTARDNFMHAMFVWDSSFTAMCTAWGWRAFPHTATLDCLYTRQMDGGYLHRETDVREGIALAYEPDFSPNPPISAVAEWKIAALTGDTARLVAVYGVLAAQHRWLRTNRQLADGTYWTTGLANGLDNSPSMGDGYPDLTAQQVHAAEMLANIARAIGKNDEAIAWEAERQATAAAMNAKLWSGSMHFYSTSLPDGGHNANKVVTGFWPLWTGLVPAERVAHLAHHLLDPKSFWRHHPLPSLAADSPHYRPAGDYWLGSTWAPTNAATAWGFARAGRIDLARKLVRRHLDVLSEIHAVNGSLWENFCAEKSAPGSWSGPDYSWTALGPTAQLYEILIGIAPDALRNRITWHLPEEAGWGLERIPLGPATIDLKVQEPGRISIATDRPFTLEVVGGGVRRERAVPAGRWNVVVAELPVIG